MQIFKRIIVPILLVSILVIGGSIYASDVTDAKYLSTIKVTNNSSSPITDGVVVFDLSTASMISGSMLNATANDCALLTGIGGSDLAFMPSVNSTYPWVAWVNSIGSNAELYEYLYSKDATGGNQVYFPGATGMSVPGTLTEPGNNFELTITPMYIDTTVVGPIISHNYSFVYIPSPGVIQVGEKGYSLYYDGVGDYCHKDAGVTSPAGGNITIEAYVQTDGVPVGGTNYFIYNAGDAPAGTNQQRLYIDTTGKLSFYLTTNAAALAAHWTSTNNLVPDIVHYIAATYDNTRVPKTIVYDNGVPMAGADVGLGGVITAQANFLGVGALHNVAWVSSWKGWIDEVRVSNGMLSAAEILSNYNNAAQLTVTANTTSLFHFDEGTGAVAYDETVNNNDLAIVNATWADGILPYLLLSISGVSPGEGNFLYSLIGGTATLTFGASSNSTAFAGSILTATGNWIIGSANITPYIGSIEYDVGGVPVGAWEWEYDTTFYDSIGANDGTPSFRTASSDSDLTAMVLLMSSTLEGSIPANPVLGGWTMITDVPDTPGNLFTEGGYDFPFGTQIVETSDAMGQDRESWLFAFVFGLAGLAALVVYGGTHIIKMGQRGSLLLATLAAGGVMFYFVTTRTIPGWSIIPFGVIALLIISWRKSVAPID